MGVILSSCLLLVSKPKGEVIFEEPSQNIVEGSNTEYSRQKYHGEVYESVRKEIDSLNNHYKTIVGLEQIPQEVITRHCQEVKDHYKEILYIIYKPDSNVLQLGWKDD